MNRKSTGVYFSLSHVIYNGFKFVSGSIDEFKKGLTTYLGQLGVHLISWEALFKLVPMVLIPIGLVILIRCLFLTLIGSGCTSNQSSFTSCGKYLSTSNKSSGSQFWLLPHTVFSLLLNEAKSLFVSTTGKKLSLFPVWALLIMLLFWSK